MEATIVEDGILLRPKAVVDRKAIADNVDAIFQDITPLPEYAKRSEDEIMEDVISNITAARKQRRKFNV